MAELMKYRKPKGKDCQKLKIVEELGCKVTQLECKVEILQGKIEQLGHKNIQLRIINKRCNGLFGTFMYKCARITKGPLAQKELWDTLNEIYSLSRKMLEEIK